MANTPTVKRRASRGQLQDVVRDAGENLLLAVRLRAAVTQADKLAEALDDVNRLMLWWAPKDGVPRGADATAALSSWESKRAELDLAQYSHWKRP